MERLIKKKIKNVLNESEIESLLFDFLKKNEYCDYVDIPKENFKYYVNAYLKRYFK